MKLMHIRSITTAAQARQAQARLKSYWSAESQLTQTVLIRCLECLERGNRAVKQKPSEWSKFFGAAMKCGLSAKEAAAEWRGRPKMRKRDAR